MKLLVIGATGQVGRQVAWLARQRGHEALGTFYYRPEPGLLPLDMAAADDCAEVITAERPDSIVIAAAYKHVDGCERDPVRARAINIQGVANVLKSARRIRCRAAMYSSD